MRLSCRCPPRRPAGPSDLAPLPDSVCCWRPPQRAACAGADNWPIVHRHQHGSFLETLMTDMKHLSIVDGAFLHLESPEMPMHVGSLALFDAPPGGASAWFEAVK